MVRISRLLAHRSAQYKEAWLTVCGEFEASASASGEAHSLHLELWRRDKCPIVTWPEEFKVEI